MPGLPGADKCDAAQAVLVVLDLQQRRGDAMPDKVLNRVIMNATLLAHSAALLAVPLLHTEQDPQALGATHATIAAALPRGAQRFTKTTFSCCQAQDFSQALVATTRRQAVLVGMEAHICVLQSALDLRALGIDVFVVEDAICSHRLENYHNALDRLRQAGVQVVSAESVVFEWLGDASHPHFKCDSNPVALSVAAAVLAGCGSLVLDSGDEPAQLTVYWRPVMQVPKARL